MTVQQHGEVLPEADHPSARHLDLAPAPRPKRDVQRVNVDFPTWMVTALDAEAARLGITRQSVIKTWIAEHLARLAP